MRGSVWAKCRVWLVNKDGSIRKDSGENIYGYGAVTDLNTEYQQEVALSKTINKILATYREHHSLDSDSEVNYHLLSDGIQYTKKDRTGENKRIEWVHGKLDRKTKRKIHREVNLQREKDMQHDIKKEYAKQDINPKLFKEHTQQEYKGIKVRRKNIRNYLGMNKPASKELRLSKKSQPKDKEIFIDKSLKGRKKRQVIAHEIYERKLMKRGMKYKDAHKRATKYEKRIK